MLADRRAHKAMHGNISAAVWNAQQLAASGAAKDGKKWAAVRERLEEVRPAVMVLLEVDGTFADFRLRRREFRKMHYECVFLAGQDAGEANGKSTANGVLALVAKEQAVFKSFERVAGRVLGFEVVHKADGVRRAYVGMHGEHGAGFGAQVRGADRYMRDKGGGLMLTDANHVPCSSWRCKQDGAVGRSLDGRDKQWRRFCGFRCACCAVVGEEEEGALEGCIVGGAGGEMDPEGGDVGFTRFATTGGKGGARAWLGPTARYDLAVARGSEGGAWKLMAQVPMEEEVGTRVAPLSDHLLVVVGREPGSAAAGREFRKRAVMLKNRSKVGIRVRARMREEEGGTLRAMHDAVALALHASASTVDAAQEVLVAAGGRAEAEVREEMKLEMCGTDSARHIHNDWKAVLQQLEAHERRGTDLCNLGEGGVMHRRGKVRAVVLESACRGLQPAVVTRRAVRYARRQVRRSGWLASLAERTRERAIVAAARERPGEDANDRFERTWAVMKEKKVGVAMEHMHVDDDPSKEKVHVSDARFGDMAAAIGRKTVGGFDMKALVTAAGVWDEFFAMEYAEMSGTAGEEWLTERELTFDLFLLVLKAMKSGKAVGQSGFSVELLRVFDGGSAIQRCFYEAMVAEWRLGTTPPSWRAVVYALLVKPAPNDPAVVAQRRDIAIMEQAMKLQLQCARSACYAPLQNRIDKSQGGWLGGTGCPDMGMCLEQLISQARLAGALGTVELWVLWVDLTTYFPSIQRDLLRAAEERHGVPMAVLDMTAAIFSANGGTPCRYDSAAGLGGLFLNSMGALMGCVLSPDKAKIFLNSLLAAIKLHVTGARLWGGEPDTVGAVWERVEQIGYADDWCGGFEVKAELRKAWLIFRAWTGMKGLGLGVKDLKKTVVSGIRWVRGAIMPVADPLLKLAGGGFVPFLKHDRAYKHLGIWRRLDGEVCDNVRAVGQRCALPLSRLWRMKHVSEREYCMVSNVLLGGVCGFAGQTCYVSWKSCEDLVEKKWRSGFRRKFGLAATTPNVGMYADGRRRHVWETALGSLYNRVVECVVDKEDTLQRGAARAGLAMALSAWGCREDPLKWDFSHLGPALFKYLESGTAPSVGEAAMYAAICADRWDVECGGARPASAGTLRLELWDEPEPGCPMYRGARHFVSAETTMVFEPVSKGGLGFEPVPLLLKMGLVAVGHFSDVGGDGSPRLHGSFAEARVRHSHLPQRLAMRAAWERCVDGLTVLEVPAEAVESVDALDGGLLDKDTCTGSANAAALDALVGSVDAAVTRLRTGGGVSLTAADWRGKIQACFGAEAAPPDMEWRTGLTDMRQLALGPRVVYEGEGRRIVFGGEARWTPTPTTTTATTTTTTTTTALGDDGWRAGWEAAADARLDRLFVDTEGWVSDLETGERLGLDEAVRSGMAVEAMVRARRAAARRGVDARAAGSARQAAGQLAEGASARDGRAAGEQEGEFARGLSADAKLGLARAAANRAAALRLREVAALAVRETAVAALQTAERESVDRPEARAALEVVEAARRAFADGERWKTAAWAEARARYKAAEGNVSMDAMSGEARRASAEVFELRAQLAAAERAERRVAKEGPVLAARRALAIADAACEAAGAAAVAAGAGAHEAAERARAAGSCLAEAAVVGGGSASEGMDEEWEADVAMDEAYEGEVPWWMEDDDEAGAEPEPEPEPESEPESKPEPEPAAVASVEAVRPVAGVEPVAGGEGWARARAAQAEARAEAGARGGSELPEGMRWVGEVSGTAILEGSVGKVGRVGNAVHRDAMSAALRRLEKWRARIDAEAIFTLDGSRGTVMDATNAKVLHVGWSSTRHDGSTISGGWYGDWQNPREAFCDNYFAEMAAQLETARQGGVSRVIIWFDATSPVRALLAYVWASPRRRQRKHGARWLDAWWSALQAFDVVVFLHQGSHNAEPLNDWADEHAGRAMADVDNVSRPALPAQMQYAAGGVIGGQGGARRWVMAGLHGDLRVRLRGESKAQVRHDEDLALAVLSPELEEVEFALLCGRCQDGDPRRYIGGLAGRRAALLVCPHGCAEGGKPARFTWVHAQFACTGAPLEEPRAAWEEALAGAARLVEAAQGGVPCQTMMRTLRAVRGGPSAAQSDVGSSDEIELRRFVGGCIDTFAGRGKAKAEAMAAIESARVLGLKLQLAGQRVTEEWRREVAEAVRQARIAKPLVAAWRQAVFRGGPRRAAELREVAVAREVAMVRRRAAFAAGDITGAEATLRRSRAKAAVVAAIRAARAVASASWSAAAKEWRWLAMVREWRVTTRRRRGARRGSSAQLVEVGTPSVVLEVLLAAEGTVQAFEGLEEGWWWLHPRAELRMPALAGGAEMEGPGMDARAIAARRRAGEGGSKRALERLRGWEVAAGRAEGSNGRWAVERLLEVQRPTPRKGRQLECKVRWMGEQPLSRRPWPDSWVQITALTSDLKKVARGMETLAFPAGAGSHARREGGKPPPAPTGGGGYGRVLRSAAQGCGQRVAAVPIVTGIQLTGAVEGMPWGTLGDEVQVQGGGAARVIGDGGQSERAVSGS